MKSLFVFSVKYSQTDSENFIVQETNKETALARLKSYTPNARYYDFIAVIPQINFIK